MRSYTSAAAEHRGAKPSFVLDGAKFVCGGGLTALDISEMARHASVDADSVAGVALMADFFHTALGPAEYRRFREHCRRHRTDSETLLKVMQGLVADFSGRPTGPPSRSQRGRSTTSKSSKAG